LRLAGWLAGWLAAWLAGWLRAMGNDDGEDVVRQERRPRATLERGRGRPPDCG